LNLPDDGDTVP